jgi:hypothetical protein
MILSASDVWYQFLLFCCQKHLSVVCLNPIAGAANNVKSRKNGE